MGPKKMKSVSDSGVKKRSITVETKKEIITKHENGVRVSDLAKQYDMAKSTICTILKNKYALRTVDVAKGVTMLSKQRSRVLEEVEHLLLVWINGKLLAGDTGSVSEALIREKALLLHGDLVAKTPNTSDASVVEFKASRGWFEKFRRRTGILRQRSNLPLPPPLPSTCASNYQPQRKQWEMASSQEYETPAGIVVKEEKNVALFPEYEINLHEADIKQEYVQVTSQYDLNILWTHRDMDSNDNNIQNSVNNCDCHIEKLLKTRFCSLSYAEKEIIIKSQKPSPSLNISCKTKAFTRHFQKSIYNNIPWICGCAHLSKLFCWPCLLFSLEQNVWNKSGFDDLNNLSKARKRHEWSQYHIDARVKFKKFGNEKRKEFSFQKSEQHKINIEQHNKEVTANRYIISKLIDVVCFLSKQDFSFRGHFEGTDSDNRGNYTELLYFLSEADVLLKNYLENSKVFKDVSNAIQNDVINSILKVLLDEIRSEIKYAKFVSIIVDESTDVCDKAQLSTVFRYVDQNDILQERFVGFTDISEDRKAYRFYDHIKKKINEFECKEKLIAHTYDGAAASEHRKIQKKIREINPSAIFVHCYAHRLNLVLSQSVSCISGCKFFFQTSLSFASFFCNSSKRLSVLDYEIKKRFPTAVPTRWNDHGKILFMIHEYKTELGNVFDLMTEDHEEWDSDTVVKARGLQYYLKDFDFNFNLELFSSVLNYVNILDEILQKQSFDINHCSKEVESFLKFLKSKRNEFDLMWDILENKEFTCLSRKRKHCDQFEDRKEIYKQRFYEIIDTLIKNTSDRFLDIGSLKLLALLDVNKFEEYRTLFPDLLLSSLRKNYSNHFDFLELKSELIYIYSSTDFSNLKTLQSLKDIIVENDLKDVIPDVYNLVNLVQTIPITSGSVECSFSKMKRIESKRRCSQIDERFSSLGLISIEKNLLFALKTANKLYDKVIEEFCQKNHSIELIFK